MVGGISRWRHKKKENGEQGIVPGLKGSKDYTHSTKPESANHGRRRKGSPSRDETLRKDASRSPRKDERFYPEPQSEVAAIARETRSPKLSHRIAEQATSLRQGNREISDGREEHGVHSDQEQQSQYSERQASTITDSAMGQLLNHGKEQEPPDSGPCIDTILTSSQLQDSNHNTAQKPLGKSARGDQTPISYEQLQIRGALRIIEELVVSKDPKDWADLIYQKYRVKSWRKAGLHDNLRLLANEYHTVRRMVDDLDAQFITMEENAAQRERRIEKLEILRRKLAERLRALRRKSKDDNYTIEDIEKEFEEVSSQKAALAADKQYLEEVLHQNEEDYQDELKRRQKIHQQEIIWHDEQSRGEITDLRSIIKNTIEAHKKELEFSQVKHHAQITKCKTEASKEQQEWENARRQLEETHKKEVAELKNKLKSELQQEREKCGQQLRELEYKYDSGRKKMEEAHRLDSEVHKNIFSEAGKKWATELLASKNGYEAAIKALESEHSRQVEMQNQEIEALRKARSEDKVEATREISEIRNEWTMKTESLQQHHKETINRISNKHHQKLASVEDEWQTRLQTATNSHAAKLKIMAGEVTTLKHESSVREQEFNSEMASLGNEHRKARTKLEKQYQAELSRERELYDADLNVMGDEIEHFKNELGLQEEQFESELALLKDQHHDALARQEMQHQEALTRQKEQAKVAQVHLKNDIRARNKALIKREAYKQLTDGEIKSMFSSLAHEIDGLARLKWTYNSSNWTDELLDQLSPTPKRLRKQILQDTIWGILFTSVFCSPYRMLGSEGKRLEIDWNTAFGGGDLSNKDVYTWPRASFESERWRHETLRQCQDALEKPLSEYDPRQKLRKGFNESLKHIQKELSQELENVTKLDENTVKSVQNISESASKLWVTFGAQRCRLVVVRQGLRTNVESSSPNAREDHFVELIVRPELRRVGDSEGELFEDETIIADCEGDITKILY